MEKTTSDQPAEKVRSGRPSATAAPETIIRWIRLLTGLLLVFAFVFVVLPAVQRIGPIREVHAATEKSGIDATALFYSEIDESSEAELAIRHALSYSPREE